MARRSPGGRLGERLEVERYQQTLQREWASAKAYASSNASRQSLPHWVRQYNEQRTHSALGNRRGSLSTATGIRTAGDAACSSHISLSHRASVPP